MLDIFSLEDEENREMGKALEEAVNEAVGNMIRRSLYSADVNLKISVRLASVADEEGRTVLTPAYEYRTGYRIGGKYDGGKGMTQGKVGMRINRDGYMETVMMPEQMKMVE